jgi:hypothetical protein
VPQLILPDPEHPTAKQVPVHLNTMDFLNLLRQLLGILYKHDLTVHEYDSITKIDDPSVRDN